MAGSFFDTNVLIYVASSDAVKATAAERVIVEGGIISVQVLNEIANVARRKMRLSWDETHMLLATLRNLLAVEPMTEETHDTGLALAERYGFSIYDAMVAASALSAGCDTLWSEDLQDGMLIDEKLRIRNPFAVGR
jgi:predicted nucleic acid-binding protein